jgi:hypothetical protein
MIESVQSSFTQLEARDSTPPHHSTIITNPKNQTLSSETTFCSFSLKYFVFSLHYKSTHSGAVFLDINLHASSAETLPLSTMTQAQIPQ